MNKVCSDDWTCTKMLTQCYFKLNYIRTLFVLKWPILAVSAKGGNLDFLDFLQKKFYNIDFWWISQVGVWEILFDLLTTDIMKCWSGKKITTARSCWNLTLHEVGGRISPEIWEDCCCCCFVNTNIHSALEPMQ